MYEQDFSVYFYAHYWTYAKDKADEFNGTIKWALKSHSTQADKW